MFFLYKLAGSLLVPPGLFILLFAAAFFLQKKGRAAFSRLLVCFSLLFFYTVSTPAGALLITGPLESLRKNSLPPDLEPAAFLVLAGGSSYDENGSSLPSPVTMDRLCSAVRAASHRSGKSVMILSGGNFFGSGDTSEARAMAAAAREIGWNGEILLEEDSRTTAENIKYSAKMLENLSIKNLVIVTSAYHMPRASAAAKEHLRGLRLYTYASGHMASASAISFWSFLPDGASFALSCAGIKEYAGMAACKAASLFMRAAGRS